MNYLEGLNPKQKEAVLHDEGPLLVIAGAGAGKTKVITERIVRLIREKGILPDEILAVTFTNKAAGEMRERVRKLLVAETVRYDSEPFVSTFHSLCVMILRWEYQAAGLKKGFTIFDRDDSRRAVRDAMKEIDPELSKRYEPNMVLSLISREKNDGKTAEEFRENRNDEFGRMIGVIWEKYERMLREASSLDFDDLITRAMRLLESHGDVRRKYLNRWKYIEIDEYHDTNAVQYRLVKLLAGEKKNVMVVGDIDQSIYGWRGADVRNLIDFEKDFEGTKVVILEENYRSSKNILDVANAVIEKNKNRFEKTLFTKQNSGEKVSVYEAYDEADEANFIGEKIKEAIGKGTKPEEIAILYRANFQSRALEEACLNKDIPYAVLGTRFFDRKEVKDLIAYILAAQNPESLSNVERIINVPARGIGKVSILKIFSGKETELTGAAKESWRKLKVTLAHIAEETMKTPPSQLIGLVFEKSGLREMLSGQGEEGLERIENVKELSAFAARYDGMPLGEGLSTFLDDVALASDQDSLERKPVGVRLSTIHASKGLEFEIVFITGLEQDLFPHRSMDNSKKRDDEEERRLFYVALTRAKKKLFLSHASTRMVFGARQWNAPSEFLFDIPDEFIDKEIQVENRGKVIYFDI